MWGVLFIILGLTLATLCIISAFKNLLSEYKLGGSLKDAAVIVPIIGILICSLLITLDGIELNLVLNQLKEETNLSKDQIQLLNALIPVKTKSALISSVVGYAMYGLHLFIFKNIQKEIDKQIEKNSKNKWRF